MKNIIEIPSHFWPAVFIRIYHHHYVIADEKSGKKLTIFVAVFFSP